MTAYYVRVTEPKAEERFQLHVMWHSGYYDYVSDTDVSVMYQYAVIANLERDGTDHYTMSSLPLHATILSIFFSEEQHGFFSQILKPVGTATPSVRTRSTQRAQYGVNEDIRVTTVSKTNELDALHRRLVEEVSEYVTFRAPQFTGVNFGPHVTDQDDKSVPVGTELLLDNLTLVEVIDQIVLVRSIHELATAT